MEGLIADLEAILSCSFKEFADNKISVGASERYFQLLVDTASDINTHILAERGGSMPDTYKQSFYDLAHEKVIEYALAEKLAESAKVRNILVHEYDFEEDYLKFYNSAKEFLLPYRKYIKTIYKFVAEEYKS